MTKQERQILNGIIKHLQSPTATAAAFENGVYTDSHAEAARLMDSEDYKKGWTAAHTQFKGILGNLLGAEPGSPLHEDSAKARQHFAKKGK